MPALLPPDMQIGANPPGWNQVPIAFSGPPKGLYSPAALPSVIQSAGASTSVSGPTNISQTVTATRAGTFLVWLVAVNASAAAALGGTPTGWLNYTNQIVGTLALGLYFYVTNPGGITAVTFSSNATATTGGIASWFFEVDNCPYAPGANIATRATGSSTAPAAGALTAPGDTAFIINAVAWVLGTATFTNTSTVTNGGTPVTSAQQSSTAGTTNAALQVSISTGFYGVPSVVTTQGTLSVSSVWDAMAITIPSSAASQTFVAGSRAFVADGGQGYGAADSGNVGWAPGGTVKAGGDGRY